MDQHESLSHSLSLVSHQLGLNRESEVYLTSLNCAQIHHASKHQVVGFHLLNHSIHQLIIVRASDHICRFRGIAGPSVGRVTYCGGTLTFLWTSVSGYTLENRFIMVDKVAKFGAYQSSQLYVAD